MDIVTKAYPGNEKSRELWNAIILPEVMAAVAAYYRNLDLVKPFMKKRMSMTIWRQW
jgi:hypothetical protein